MPARLASGPTPGSPPLSRLKGEEAIAIRSPLPGVAPRHWLHAAMAAVDHHGPPALLEALDADGLAKLGTGAGRSADLAVCPVCGHTSTGAPSTTISPATPAAAGWAPPGMFAARGPTAGGTPSASDRAHNLTWTELQAKVRWRNRILVVEFRLWAAVLLSPSKNAGAPA